MFVLILALPAAWTLIALFPSARSFGILAATYFGWGVGVALARDPHFYFAFAAAIAVLLMLCLGGWVSLEIGLYFRRRRSEGKVAQTSWNSWRTWSLGGFAFVAARKIAAQRDIALAVKATLVEAGCFSAVCALFFLWVWNEERGRKKINQEIDEELARMRADSVESAFRLPTGR